MAELVTPTTRVHASFLAALIEYQEEDATAGLPVGLLADVQLFDRFVQDIAKGADPAHPRAPGHVPYTMLWWVEGDTYLGRVSIRHELTPALARYGGHIGYDVRPSARRRGHASLMLSQAIGVAAGLGLDRVLLTCDKDNIASKKVIIANGGVVAPHEDFDDGEGSCLRYWIATARKV